MDDLSEIERLAGALLRQLEPAQRRALLRSMSRDVVKRQRSRIASQKNPDGSPFAPRAPKTPPMQGRYAVSFLYPSGGFGAPRHVTLKSYTVSNKMMTGYDLEAEGIRSFFFDKVIKWLPVPSDKQNVSAGRLRKRGSLRRAAMFRRLSSARYLRSGNDDLEFWVGFTGRAAEVARIHQEGLKDKPAKNAREIHYPQRRVLGFSGEDRQALLDSMLQHFSRITRA